MAMRILLADRRGTIRRETDALPEEISWRLNNVGRLRFKVPSRSALLQDGYLQFGNRLLCQFDNGLPDWGGIIDPPRKWRGKLSEITAYSGEYALSWRTTDKGRYFSGATAGAIFEALIEEANAIDDTGVAIGDVWQGGNNHSPDYHLAQVLKTIQDSVVGRLSSGDFAVIPALVGGRITFTANFYERRGRVKNGVALVEGANLTAITLREEGTIVNDLTIAGADTSGEGADGWGDGRLLASGSDADSINRYGRRQGSDVFTDISVQGTLDDLADKHLAQGKAPHNRWELTADDRKPARFADYDVGDTLPLVAPSYGIGGTDTICRVLGRDFDPAAGVCNLVVEEI